MANPVAPGTNTGNIIIFIGILSIFGGVLLALAVPGGVGTGLTLVLGSIVSGVFIIGFGVLIKLVGRICLALETR